MEDRNLSKELPVADDAAFLKLLEEHLRAVYNFLYRFTDDPEITDDLTQETFIKVWKNIRRFDRSKSLKTWIFAIAKNTAYDFLKKKKTLPFSSFEDEDGNSRLEEISDDNMLPGEILERQDLALELERNLKKISKEYQIILLMLYKDDFSLMEIAKILGRPYSTVKSQHSRAILRLRKAFLEK